jgi:thiamine transport system permease protein
VFESWLTSVALGLSVGCLHLLLFLLTAYILPHERLDRFLNGYLAPSPAVTGFALLLVPLEGDVAEFFKLTAALTLISFPLLYRWLAHSALTLVRGQVQVARALGADWRLILFEIVWPQAAPQLLRASGLAALWACGDFAVSGIVGGGGLRTLPLLMQDLLGHYRIEAAQLLMLPLLATGLGLYVMFKGAARYVAR